MELFMDLFKSDVGVMSALSILGVLCIAGYMYFWVRRKVREEEGR